ncbi:MAG: acyl-CoA synthetase (AMP-forming)/AMP-acid ligase II [Myxococcota bacterium]|jgi:acyl-CoA synthetase (AMP-forming)/AMP-acid ligase II
MSVLTTTPELLAWRARTTPDAPALVDGDTRLTFAELDQTVTRLAKGWMALGIGHGYRVGIQAPNTWEWVAAALSLHAVGAILVPINTRYKGHETAWILNKSGASAWVTVQGFLGADYPAQLQAADDAPNLPTILLKGETTGEQLSLSQLESLGEEVPWEHAAQRRGAVGPDDPSDILFTSGTTGDPKGVVTTHAQTLRAYASWAEVVGLRADDRYLVVAPFFHCFGYKAGWLAALIAGAAVYPQPVFDVGAVLERIGRDRITMLPGPPALYQTILGRADRDSFDLSTLRLAVTGAAVIPVTLIERMRDELGFETVITGYGLTEATGIATMCRHDDDPATIAATSGRAIDGVEVQVVGADGSEVARGEPGEVVVRGYNVMLRYFDEPAATKAAVDADGWLHTGDIGVMNEAGYIRITDRLKDMFIMGGFNCYPAEIERLMLKNPDYQQVAVIGVADERMGEVGKAFVVAAQGVVPTPESVVAWCRENMANFKVPRHVDVVEALPMNATGKVKKFELRGEKQTNGNL